jgi:hypothetical protein
MTESGWQGGMLLSQNMSYCIGQRLNAPIFGYGKMACV